MKNSSSSKIMLTESVAESPDRDLIIETVRNFDSFGPNNDPHQEHDCAVVKVKGESYIFKIDYYDQNLEYGVDPMEEDCIRVLTIMHARDY